VALVGTGEVQFFPHVPQLVAEVFRFVSQPFPALLSQSPYPLLQAMSQVPPEQVGVPFVELQATPHAPQFETLP